MGNSPVRPRDQLAVGLGDGLAAAPTVKGVGKAVGRKVKGGKHPGPWAAMAVAVAIGTATGVGTAAEACHRRGGRSVGAIAMGTDMAGAATDMAIAACSCSSLLS